MYNYTDKVYTLHVPGKTLIENKYKNYALADDKVFNGSISPLIKCSHMLHVCALYVKIRLVGFNKL